MEYSECLTYFVRMFNVLSEWNQRLNVAKRYYLHFPSAHTVGKEGDGIWAHTFQKSVTEQTFQAIKSDGDRSNNLSAAGSLKLEGMCGLSTKFRSNNCYHAP
ncbi:hypothetical protein CIRG_06585 [Coccidioides immitis RMSCC 2394]|uniref:Uncharacterized protein n=1 Tax=Coccidioides immitis RMSCC 2394 TaxID=404692 RepID=A0A0J6YIJ2_COCIT|nr:hypothetical protein CIRG_06585 [Coccidioides immitis RMSCC 2394]